MGPSLSNLSELVFTFCDTFLLFLKKKKVLKGKSKPAERHIFFILGPRSVENHFNLTMFLPTYLFFYAVLQFVYICISFNISL